LEKVLAVFSPRRPSPHIATITVVVAAVWRGRSPRSASAPSPSLPSPISLISLISLSLLHALLAVVEEFGDEDVSVELQAQVRAEVMDEYRRRLRVSSELQLGGVGEAADE